MVLRFMPRGLFVEGTQEGRKEEMAMGRMETKQGSEFPFLLVSGEFHEYVMSFTIQRLNSVSSFLKKELSLFPREALEGAKRYCCKRLTQSLSQYERSVQGGRYAYGERGG